MKYLLLLMSSFWLSIACTSSHTEDKKPASDYIIEESLSTYNLSATDTVYSVKVVLQSEKATTLTYFAQLTQQGITYRDSMIFDLEANQKTTGQLIFSTCPVVPNQKATLNSQITVLEP